MVDQDQGTIDGFESFGLAADHFQLNKYPSPDDPNYERILSQLMTMIAEAPNRINARLHRESYEQAVASSLC